MKMFFNNDSNHAIEITSFFRGLETNSEVGPFFRFELNFSGNYSSENLDYLATFINQDITDIRVLNKNDEEVLTLHNVQARLQNLYENYNDENKSGNATIRVFYLNNSEE